MDARYRFSMALCAERDVFAVLLGLLPTLMLPLLVLIAGAGFGLALLVLDGGIL